MRSDVRQAFEHLGRIFTPPTDTTGVDVLGHQRRAMERYGDIAPQILPADVQIIPARIGDLAAEWIVPKDSNSADRLLHLHGGGYITGSLASHRWLVAQLAVRSRRAALHISYARAPEQQFPAAHDDCERAYAWIGDNGPGGPGAARSLNVSGDSIGGSLAVDLVAQAIERGGAIPDTLALVCPTLDIANDPPRQAVDTDLFINAEILAACALYAGGRPLSDPRLSPLQLGDRVLARFPPTIIQASTAEFLLPDAVTLARRLTSQHRRVVLSLWAEMPHVWHAFGDHFREGAEALAELGRFISADRSNRLT